MKYLQFPNCLITGMILAVTVNVSAADTKLDSRISAVTVYRDRAVVTRTASVDLTTGNHRLIFSDIPIAADESSIHASVRGDGLRVQGLMHKNTSIGGDSTRKDQLNRTLDTLYNHKLAALNDSKAVLEKQRALLEQLVANVGQSLSSDLSKASFNAKNWDDAYAFISRNLSAVVDSLRVISLMSAAISTRCHELEAERGELQVKADRRVREVVVDVAVASAGELRIALDYMVPQASWSPLYNARLIDSNRVEISYYGQVVQKTGEDWKDVALTLSTALPSRVSTPGSLAARILATYEPNLQKFGSIHVRSGRSNDVMYAVNGALVTDPLGGRVVEDMAIVKAGFDAEYGNASSGIIRIDRSSTALSTQFVVSRPETVPSGDQVIRTPITLWTIDGEETLVARPQNQQYVFRLLKLKNTTGAPLLPGMINLFAHSDYIGRYDSPDLILPDQEFEMPFGIDDRIEIKREILNRINSVDGDKHGLSETVSTTLINHSGVERTIELEEALPTSNDSRVNVDIRSMTPKPHETDVEHKAKWHIRLAANGKAVISIDYKIEYPKSLTVTEM